MFLLKSFHAFQQRYFFGTVQYFEDVVAGQRVVGKFLQKSGAHVPYTQRCLCEFAVFGGGGIFGGRAGAAFLFAGLRCL